MNWAQILTEGGVATPFAIQPWIAGYDLGFSGQSVVSLHDLGDAPYTPVAPWGVHVADQYDVADNMISLWACPLLATL